MDDDKEGRSCRDDDNDDHGGDNKEKKEELSLSLYPSHMNMTP